jgi:ferredoxin
MEKSKNIKQWFADHKPTKRRIIQLYAALLTNANLKGYGNGKIYQGAVKNICAPGLNCYSCPAASASCPLGALQNALASSNARLPYYIFGIFLLFGILFGRWICGFLCPFGLLQDLLHKVKTPKLKKNSITRILSYLKYVILVVFVVLMPLIYSAQSFPLPGFCKYICPSGTLLGAGGLLSNEANSNMFPMLGPLFTWKFCLLVLILLSCIFIYRAFCRFLCPLGAIYGLFNRISILGIKLDKPKCTDCGICIGTCHMDIRHVGDHECISCGECITACPTGAITYKGPKILLAPNESGGAVAGVKLRNIDPVDAPGTPLPQKTRIARCIVALAMALLLIGALIYYNFIDKVPESDVPQQGSSQEIDVGGEIGDICIDHELSVYGSEDTIRVSDYRGKVTIVNFWYIFCGSCVKELQTEFPLIKEEYGDQVEILAVHSYEEYNSDIPAFIAQSFPDADFTFCRDTEGEAYFHMLGGSQAWPVTVVLDENGVIVSSIMGSTTYDELKSIIDNII